MLRFALRCILIARRSGSADAAEASPPQANPKQQTGAPHGYSAGRFYSRRRAKLLNLRSYFGHRASART
jgi:hypothetical protein